MRLTLTIILNDLNIFFSQRGNLVGLLVIPVLLTLVVGLSLGSIGGDGPTRLRVDLIDLDQSEMSALLVEELRTANDALALCPQDNDSEDYCRLEGEPLPWSAPSIARGQAPRKPLLSSPPATPKRSRPSSA